MGIDYQEITKMMGDDEIEDWDEIEEVDLSKKRYFTNEHLEKIARSNRERTLKTQDEVLGEFRERFGDKFDYSKFEYVHTRKKVIIICRIHGEFQTSPFTHKQSKNGGCRKCQYELISKKMSGNKQSLLGGHPVEVDREKFTELVRLGKKQEEISKELNISIPTVYRRKKRWGLITRKSPK